ncbi:hypothetical protein AMATHDRAFT_5912 [Amanita thiersii Skay4041]|uniref:carnosine N-methyltransferase n=1 Tax=Amanita thiersii Skay4041 TaxID=703135 RepID=A0A2A9NKW0_9AGAR|nr:hypothetical protein AMATHDRAFT_5912 [Amanita thiersii Skay4041]
MPLTEADIEEEERHFQQVVNAFKNYARFSISVNNRRRRDIYRLPKADQDILDSIGFKKKVEDADKAILANAQFLAQMVDNPEIFGSDIDSDGGTGVDEPSGSKKPPSASDSAGGKHSANSNVIPPSHSHSHSHGHSHEHVPRRGQDHHHTRGATSSQPRSRSTENDMDKLRSTLKQFVRDWSTEGKEERDLCYQPMKDALLKYFSHVPESERGKLRVLVPGAGLGRLAWDVAALGFTCQANEFSHYMLLGSFFILNRTDQIEKHTFYPYVHSFSNIPDRNALLRPIKIPDVLPSDLPRTANFSLVAGDFEEVYGAPVIDPSEPHAGLWDAILTCFFIDTAKNVVNYLRIIHKLLAPGGVWVNLGPLLWHWEHNETNEVSVELDLDELKALVRKMGFEISNERTIDTTYTNNIQSMIGYTYHTAFWTATKVA